jgi:hypothetical protein
MTLAHDDLPKVRCRVLQRGEQHTEERHSLVVAIHCTWVTRMSETASCGFWVEFEGVEKAIEMLSKQRVRFEFPKGCWLGLLAKFFSIPPRRLCSTRAIEGVRRALEVVFGP